LNPRPKALIGTQSNESRPFGPFPGSAGRNAEKIRSGTIKHPVQSQDFNQIPDTKSA
jgi:hypothetical protein